MTDLDMSTIRQFTWGYPFIVHCNGASKRYAANVAWIKEEDGRLHVAATIDEEHETIQVSGRDVIMESGVRSFIGDIYPAGEWKMERITPE